MAGPRPLTALQLEGLRLIARAGDVGAPTAGWWSQFESLKRRGFVRLQSNLAQRPRDRWFVTEAGRAALVGHLTTDQKVGGSSHG